jgi:hyperosmotically inducible periplasmic protein
MRRISMLMLAAALFGFGTTRVALGDEMPGRATAQAESQIQTRFQSDADLRNNSIQATIENGVVTLKGTVDTDGEKAKAARLAMVKGVTHVDNQLKVGSETTKAAMTDSTITARLKTELLAEETLRGVHVETNNAVVSLSGTAPTAAARDRAIDLARSMSGVSRVEDNIKVLPPR